MSELLNYRNKKKGIELMLKISVNEDQDQNNIRKMINERNERCNEEAKRTNITPILSLKFEMKGHYNRFLDTVQGILEKLKKLQISSSLFYKESNYNYCRVSVISNKM